MTESPEPLPETSKIYGSDYIEILSKLLIPFKLVQTDPYFELHMTKSDYDRVADTNGNPTTSDGVRLTLESFQHLIN